uniref:Cell adhesion molecule 3-like n=1 Tax=Drosophila rhopaloa TaxID=1041015 RepID=A0A6P4EII5_DRORH
TAINQPSHGVLSHLFAISAVVWGNHHESLSLSPAEHSVVRYTNESLIVQCRSPNKDVKLHWKSPRGEIIREHKGRIHIEQTSPEQLKIVFAHIALADKGNWTCEAPDEGLHSKSLDLIVYHKPIWSKSPFVSMQYAYINGTATLVCESLAEPPANFTWHRKHNKLHSNNKLYTIESDSYWSLLTIHVLNASAFDNYRCRAANHLGTIERTTRLEQGDKPPAPANFKLRGFNSNT